MWPPQVCVSCGTPIGCIYQTFVALRERKMAKEVEEKKISRKQLANDDTILVDFSPLFDRLGLELECCRKTIAFAILLKDQY